MDVSALPLFPSEKQIAELVVGPERAKDWPAIAQTLEKRGFPRIHPVMGGRKLHDVLAYFEDRAQGNLPDHQRSFTVARNAPDGPETPHAASATSHNSRRPADRNRRSGT